WQLIFAPQSQPPFLSFFYELEYHHLGSVSLQTPFRVPWKQ
ncbi:MAG: hypothetical protein ACI875_002406, partial [Planctomycetota bacterium]